MSTINTTAKSAVALKPSMREACPIHYGEYVAKLAAFDEIRKAQSSARAVYMRGFVKPDARAKAETKFREVSAQAGQASIAMINARDALHTAYDNALTASQAA